MSEKSFDSVTREMKTLEFSARYVWPAARIFVRGSLSRRCTRCLASEKYARLVGDVCEWCAEIDTGSVTDTGPDIRNDTATMTALLDEVFQQNVGAGKGDYDALLLFSGGKDSCYLLHRLKRDYPELRLLAVTIDNNFMSPIAMNNVKLAIGRMNVDHMTYRPPLSFSAKMFKYAFTHLNEKGCAGTVDQFDGDSIFDMARNLAANLRIPLVIGGISPIQVANHIGVDWFEVPRECERKKRTHVAGLSLEDIFSRAEMRLWWDGTRWEENRIPRVLFPFYAWGYDETVTKKALAELDLIPRGNDNPLLTNSQLVPLMALVDIAHLGYSSFEPEFSRLVREGKAQLNFWRNLFEMAEYSAKTGRFIKKSIDDVLRLLDLTRRDVGLRCDA